MEEGVFRGLFIKTLSETKSFMKANYIAAFLFGVWHIVMPIRSYINGEMSFAAMVFMGVGYIILSGIMGIKWGLLYRMTGDVWIGLGDHLLNNTVAIALIEESDFKKFGANNEYTEGIAETLRTIKTVEVSAVLKESDNQTTKVSLRSDNIDVCEIVKKFNGGGHIHAAGCTIKKPLKIAYELLVDEIEKCLNS